MPRAVSVSARAKSSTERARNSRTEPHTSLLLDEFDSDDVPGVLNRRLRSRVLLWQEAGLEAWPADWLGRRLSPTAIEPPSSAWFRPEAQAAPGITLDFEGVDPNRVGSGRLETLEDCQLWLPASAAHMARHTAPELLERVEETGGRVLVTIADLKRPGLLRLQPLSEVPAAPCPPDASATDMPGNACLLYADVLRTLPAAQRFQGKLALVVDAAASCSNEWRAAEETRRQGPIQAGAMIHMVLEGMLGLEESGRVLGALVGAVRSRNSLDHRLRNMPNERLALLLLVAVGRLSERARAFTVREICREVGSVATGT